MAGSGRTVGCSGSESSTLSHSAAVSEDSRIGTLGGRAGMGDGGRALDSGKGRCLARFRT